MFLSIAPLKKHHDYRLLYTGQLVSMFGSMITYVAVPYQVYDLTHSSFAVGMLGASQLVPLLLFALWGGAYADAMDRRRLLIVSEIFMTAGSLALALNGLLVHPSVALIFVVSAAMSACNGFHRPALDAMTPRLVDREDLTAVSALNSFRFSMSAIGGPALGGICITALGYPLTYTLDVLSFLVSLVSLAAIRRMPPADGTSRPGIQSISEGLKYALSRPELIGTYAVDMVAMTFAMPMALFPAMAISWGGAKAAGWLYSAMSIGSLFTTLFSGWTSKVMRHGAAVVTAAAIWALAIVGVGFAPGLYTAVVCLAMAGAADSVSAVFRGTIWNETIPSDLRGRLAGVEMISYLSGPLLGNARAGWVASISSNTISIVSGGMTCFIGVLLCIPLLPAFWNYRAEREPAADIISVL
ncbi:MAG TPA: MFS transporter [Terriglobia bacterium]|nr:MFS transporter [Terriglobia bacterium]